MGRRPVSAVSNRANDSDEKSPSRTSRSSAPADSDAPSTAFPFASASSASPRDRRTPRISAYGSDPPRAIPHRVPRRDREPVRRPARLSRLRASSPLEGSRRRREEKLAELHAAVLFHLLADLRHVRRVEVLGVDPSREVAQVVLVGSQWLVLSSSASPPPPPAFFRGLSLRFSLRLRRGFHHRRDGGWERRKSEMSSSAPRSPRRRSCERVAFSLPSGARRRAWYHPEMLSRGLSAANTSWTL